MGCYMYPCTCAHVCMQAQLGVQRKKFKHLDDMVEYYRHSRRGLVCALTLPIPQAKQGEGEDKEEDLDSGDLSHDL